MSMKLNIIPQIFLDYMIRKINLKFNYVKNLLDRRFIMDNFGQFFRKTGLPTNENFWTIIEFVEKQHNLTSLCCETVV